LEIPVIPFRLIQDENGKFEKRNLSSWKQWMEKPQTKQDFNALNWTEANAFAVLLGTKAKNENSTLDVFHASKEKAVNHGTAGTGGTVLGKIYYCWNTCRSYKSEGEYVCTHPNPTSVNQKTTRPLKCPGFNPILRRS